MQTSRIARFRAYEPSLGTFARWARWSFVGMFLVVVSGAAVRLTGSGLGCDHWPRCGDKPYPETGGHAAIEFGNRVVAFTVIVMTLVTWLLARRSHRVDRRTRRLAGWVFAMNVAQIPLGGVTVIFDLHPLLVMAHFLLGVTTFTLATLVALESRRIQQGEVAPLVPGRIRTLGLLLAIAGVVLYVSGSFATAAGPHPGSSDQVDRLGETLRSVRIHGVFTILFGIALAIVILYLERGRKRWPRLADTGLLLVGLLVAQIALGEVQYRTGLPWGLVLVHVGLSAATLAVLIALVRWLYRPPASLAPSRT